MRYLERAPDLTDFAQAPENLSAVPVRIAVPLIDRHRLRQKYRPHKKSPRFCKWPSDFVRP